MTKAVGSTNRSDCSMKHVFINKNLRETEDSKCQILTESSHNGDNYNGDNFNGDNFYGDIDIDMHGNIQSAHHNMDLNNLNTN